MDFFRSLASKLVQDRCQKLQDVSYFNLILSIFILVGILVSYLPQHYRIISRGTSEGLSTYFILLGATSGTCAFATILVLPSSRADVACCSTVSAFECAAGLLGIAQVGAQWLCFSIVLVLFLVYFPRESILPDNENDPVEDAKHNWKTAVAVGFLCFFHLLATIFMSLSVVLRHPHYSKQWANILGIIAAILSITQYIPQIHKTWKLGRVESLSIPMMLIQTPGSFVFAASLAARLGAEGWASWGVFVITGCLQGSLLIMGIWFEMKAMKENGGNEIEDQACGTCIVGYIPSPRLNETDDEGGAIVEDNETAPLIKSGSRKSSRNRHARD